MMIPATPLTDPDGSAPLLGAATWVRALVTGTPATILATIAVTAVGLMMLTGRLPVRRAASVLVGCFIIFGAESIAAGLLGIGTLGAGTAVPAATEPTRPAPIITPVPPKIYDPYAGASVPIQ